MFIDRYMEGTITVTYAWLQNLQSVKKAVEVIFQLIIYEQENEFWKIGIVKSGSYQDLNVNYA